jgi:cell division protein FtsW (lipid II flippase)
MLVGIAILMLVISWYAPNIGRALAILTIASMLAVLFHEPKQPRRRYRTPQAQVTPTSARAFLGVAGVMFVLAHVASRRRRKVSPIAPAIVVRR